jgi:paraquat-inducible protein B
MSSKATYFKVGLFTVTALAIFAAAVLYFGLSQAFQPLLQCETFFNHSVQGLRSGAAVQFRGFNVGSVSTIAITKMPGGQGGRQMVKVNFTINPALISGDKGQSPEHARRFLEDEIRSGLRIYLSLQGVSGITYLNLDYSNDPSVIAMTAGAPEGPRGGPGGAAPSGEPMAPVLPGDSTLVIPSVQSTILEIGESMTQIVRTIRDIDFKTLVDKSTVLMGNLEQLTSQLNRETGGFTETLLGAISETQTAASQVGELAKSMNAQMTDFLKGSQMKELEATLADTRKTLNRLDNLMKAPQATLPTTLDNLRVMSENLREFSEMARNYPSQIFLGGPPPVK